MNDKDYKFFRNLMQNWHNYVPQQKEVSATAKALMPLHEAINNATEDMDIHSEPLGFCIVLARISKQKDNK